MINMKLERKISLDIVNEKYVMITSRRKVMRKTKYKNVMKEKFSMNKKTIP